MLRQLGDDLYIVDVEWLPQCSTHLAVLTKLFLKIYDLSKDTMSPAFCINEIQDISGINSMTALTIASQVGNPNAHRIYVGTNSGTIYTHLLDSSEMMPETDALYFIETVQIKGDIPEIENDATNAVVSLYYSDTSGLLFVSYECGLTLFGTPVPESNGGMVMESPIIIDIKKAYPGAMLGYTVHFQDLGVKGNTSCIAFTSIKDENWIPVM